jgi:hypothetical protein
MTRCIGWYSARRLQLCPDVTQRFAKVDAGDLIPSVCQDRHGMLKTRDSNYEQVLTLVRLHSLQVATASDRFLPLNAPSILSPVFSS